MLFIAPPRKYNDKILIVTALPIDEPSIADPPPSVPAAPAPVEAAAPMEAAPMEAAPAAAEAAEAPAAAAAPTRRGRKPARRGGTAALPPRQYLGLNLFCLNLSSVQLL